MTNQIQIISNYQPRDFLSWHDLTEAERKNFDWIDEERRGEHNFIRYRGHVYALTEFMHCPWSDSWQGYSPDSFSCGVVIRFDMESEGVICGTYAS